jgi:hypothetical protein
MVLNGSVAQAEGPRRTAVSTAALVLEQDELAFAPGPSGEPQMTEAPFNDTPDCENAARRFLRVCVGLASGRIVLTF